ncbi:glycosyltransferase family 8 protein [uncultured Muribaculum sp.]|uniref:glycosyltransferase family 8 protein n=1 Tax=uncultured Muribaculum sp. TaxID=1918613 RepID=UPI0026119DF8|nr:glycosyltransferase family 8 protein [uncultured Muribaculum sp.]
MDTIEIVCNIDESYVPYCGIMLTSLLENNRDVKTEIHIVAANLSRTATESLRNIVENIFNQTIHFYFVGDEMVKNLPHFENDYISLSTYFRCFLTEILPQNINKVIYLDCDIIILDSLKPLWETDISGYAVAAVEDMNSSFIDKHSRLGLNETYLYFNAGVLLINLDYWKENQVFPRLINWLEHNRNRIVAHDQDLLNAVLHDETMYLPHRWNMQEGMLRRRRHTLPSSEEAIDREMRHPVIIHFAGKHKPWQEKCLNPFKKQWEHYTDLTQWKGMRPKKHLGFTLNKITFPLQDKLGLRNGYKNLN